MTAVLSGEKFTVKSVKNRTFNNTGETIDDPIGIFQTFANPDPNAPIFTCGKDATCIERIVKWEAGPNTGIHSTVSPYSFPVLSYLDKTEQANEKVSFVLGSYLHVMDMRHRIRTGSRLGVIDRMESRWSNDCSRWRCWCFGSLIRNSTNWATLKSSKASMTCHPDPWAGTPPVILLLLDFQCMQLSINIYRL